MLIRIWLAMYFLTLPGRRYPYLTNIRFLWGWIDFRFHFPWSYLDTSGSVYPYVTHAGSFVNRRIPIPCCGCSVCLYSCSCFSHVRKRRPVDNIVHPVFQDGRGVLFGCCQVPIISIFARIYGGVFPFNVFTKLAPCMVADNQVSG